MFVFGYTIHGGREENEYDSRTEVAGVGSAVFGLLMQIKLVVHL